MGFRVSDGVGLRIFEGFGALWVPKQRSGNPSLPWALGVCVLCICGRECGCVGESAGVYFLTVSVRAFNPTA